MDSVERLRTALNGGQPDRVPVANWFGLPVVKQFMPPGLRVHQMFDLWMNDPVTHIVRWQEKMGFDPMVCTFTEHVGESQYYPEKLFSWPEEALVNWRIEDTVKRGATYRETRRVIHIPKGELTYAYRLEKSVWPTEYLLKEEKDIELLQYRPDPALMNMDRMARMVESAKGRAIHVHSMPSVWGEACELRGFENLAVDLYGRPAWVRELLAICTERAKRLARRLASTGLDVLVYDSTWLGVGLLPNTYAELIQSCDAQVVEAAHQAGTLVSYHNCGRSTQLLELMADTGADALETLTPVEINGDTQLDDAKRRIGDRICLWGGFNERVLASENPEDVRNEVRRCLDAAAAGGGYILRAAGQIFEATRRNLEIMTETAEQYGCY